MAMTSQSRYRSQDDDLSSDDSFDWSSDSAPKTKRKTTRKAGTTATSKTSSATKGSIKKAKKPGRKPLESVAVLPSDPKLKRKAQNRAAQRAFRERKEQFVNELQDQMRELQQAKEKREKELSAENARLKRENEKLKEENYLLKDAQFTFQFPAKEKQQDAVDGQSKVKSTPMPLVSPPNTDHQTMLSSPDMDNQSQADKSMFSCGCEDSSKCGELSDYQGGSTSDSARSVPETSFTTANETKEPEFTFNTTTDPSPFGLYNGKENTFLTHSANEADFLIQSEPLPALFGTEMDLFGAPDLNNYEENGELDAFFSEQMQTLVDQEALLKCAPENEKPCKKKVLGMLRRSRGANRSIAQINQDVKSYCPDFNLDQLCEDLKKKITFEPHHTLTEDDVDLYIECIQRHA
ncbi:basic-leucine zipper transcription factor [Mucor lusitanicus]|uniref:Basic-leucine zipper transcription factor n=1 Tax=Mucor circinelloides f. lusitanicus TaxID=29924 RepID=A0A8H4BUA4_MUCCL|nr:basic-leucine zipper transcription factor [Mucor lusitanicus]